MKTAENLFDLIDIIADQIYNNTDSVGELGLYDEYEGLYDEWESNYFCFDENDWYVEIEYSAAYKDDFLYINIDKVDAFHEDDEELSKFSDETLKEFKVRLERECNSY